MKTATQEITEYIQQLKDLLQQSEQIKREIKRHIKFSKLQNRIGAVKQQLEFIRTHVFPLSQRDKTKYFKHNKLALKLINRHFDEIEAESSNTLLAALKADEEKWAAIEALREETLHQLELLEARIQEAEATEEPQALEQKAEEIQEREEKLTELTDKTELLLEDIVVHNHYYSPIFEYIHHLHHELQFIKLHMYSRFPFDTHHGFLQHHVEAVHEVTEHLLDLENRWNHIIHHLHAEDHDEKAQEKLHQDILHTIAHFEHQLKDIKAHEKQQKLTASAQH